MSPLPHGRVEGIGEDLTSSREGNPSPLLFLLQGQGWLPALSIGKTSFSLPLAPSPSWGKMEGLEEMPLSLASLHRGTGHPGRTGGAPGSSLFPYAHFSCLLCLASWMPGLPGDNWDTGDLNVSPVPLCTSSRQDLPAHRSQHQPAGVGLSLPSVQRRSFVCLYNNPAGMHFLRLMKGGFIAPALRERRGLLTSLFSSQRSFK